MTADALAAAYRAYQPRLVRYATHLVQDADVAADVVQEVFAWLVVHPAAREIGNLAGYLRRAVRGRALNELRQGRRFRSDTLAPDEYAAVGRDLNLRLDIDAALAVLPPRTREAFERSRAGWTYPEVAVTMGTSVGTIEKQVSRGLHQMRTHLAA